MSRILRRPMFRGGPVSSYGNGIASGLANGGMPPKRGLVDGPGNYSGAWQNFLEWTSRNASQNEGITGAEIVEASKNKWMSGNKKIYGPSSEWGEKPTIQELVGTGYNVGRPDPNEPLLSYLYASGDDPESESTDIFMKEWVNEDAIKENELKAEHKESGSELPYDTWKAIEKENKAVEKAEQNALTLGGTQNPIKKVEGLSDTSILNTNITADDAELSLEEIKEALGGKKAKVQDWSDAALNFFAQTQKEGATLGSALGATAEKVASKPSRTEVIDKEAATFMLKDKYQTKRDKAKVDLMKSQIDYKLSEGRKISLSEGILASTKGGQTTDKKLAIGIQSSTSPVTGDKYKFVGVTDASGLKAALAGGQLKAGDTVIVKQKITKEDGTEKTIKKIIEIDLDGNPQEVFNI